MSIKLIATTSCSPVKSQPTLRYLRDSNRLSVFVNIPPSYTDVHATVEQEFTQETLNFPQLYTLKEKLKIIKRGANDFLSMGFLRRFFERAVDSILLKTSRKRSSSSVLKTLGVTVMESPVSQKVPVLSLLTDIFESEEGQLTQILLFCVQMLSCKESQSQLYETELLIFDKYRQDIKGDHTATTAGKWEIPTKVLLMVEFLYLYNRILRRDGFLRQDAPCLLILSRNHDSPNKENDPTDLNNIFFGIPEDKLQIAFQFVYIQQHLTREHGAIAVAAVPVVSRELYYSLYLMLKHLQLCHSHQLQLRSEKPSLSKFVELDQNDINGKRGALHGAQLPLLLHNDMPPSAS